MDNDFLPQLDEIPAQLLWSAFKLWQQHRSAGLKELGLTHAQFITLAALLWLVKRNKHVTQVMLAQRSKVDIMHTSRIVRSLEKKGLLTRMQSAEDFARKLCAHHPKGRKDRHQGPCQRGSGCSSVLQTHQEPGKRVYRFDEDPYPGK